MKKVVYSICVIMLMVFIFMVPASALMPISNSYILDNENEHIAVPNMFTTVFVKSEFIGSETVTLSNPQDLHYDKNGFYYIADTGNNRVLKLDIDFNLVAEIKEADGIPFSSPSGVSSDSYGDVYIADSDNSRIVHLNSKFEYIESFVKPESDLLYDVEFFAPSKVSFDPISNFIYVIQGKQFMKIDALNKFKGYIGDNKVGFDLWDYLFRKFATEKQKLQTAKREPDAYTNFCLGEDGRLYAVGLNDSQRISVINTVGSNIYPSGDYGETIYSSNGEATTPIFTDIAVNSYGIIFVSEENTGCIYQYDIEGNLLGTFGGKGDSKSVFNIISSIVVGEDNALVTLDSALGRIQVFEPTEFTNTVHEAISLYSNGKYDESYNLWKQVSTKNASYSLARQMIGQIEYKNGNYEEAKKEFYQGNDQEYYGKAFEKIRYKLFKEHFGVVVFVVVVVLVGVIVLIKFSRKFIAKIRKDLYGGKVVR